MTVEEIEKAVAKLPPEEFARFCSWLDEFEMSQSTKDGFYHASEEELRRLIRDAGFIPKQRDTLYRTYFLN